MNTLWTAKSLESASQNSISSDTKIDDLFKNEIKKVLFPSPGRECVCKWKENRIH